MDLMTRLFVPLLVTAISFTTGMAQTEIPEGRKAVTCFDFQITRLLESELAQSLGEDGLSEFVPHLQTPTPFSKYARVFGCIGAVDDVEELKSRGPVFSFLLTYQMVDADSAQALFGDMDFSDTPEVFDGVEYWRMLAPGSKERGERDFYGRIKDEKIVVFGSKDFVLGGKMNTLFSDELATTWSRQSDAPIRFSVEMKSKTEEVHEAIKLEGWNPETLEIVNNFESLNVSIDPAANEMIVMRGMKREGAEGEVKLGTELLPELAKQVWYRPPSWVDEYPRTNAILNSMAEKFETTRTDREVTTIIRRPEGLAEAVAEFSERSTAKRKELERKRNERTRRK